MHIGVPNESAGGERRVSVTPDVAGRLVDAGHQLLVESGAGAAAGFPDDAFKTTAAGIVDEKTAWGAELVAVVARPDPRYLSLLRSGAVLLGLLQPLDHPEAMPALAATGVTAYAFETLPRVTRAQTMDALSSQATSAGYQAVLLAAAELGKFLPMLTTAAGTIAPARVLVLGAGVAGLQAIATARRLGAVVSAFDVRAAAAEQVESLGATFIALDLEPQDAAASGGYARELEADAQARLLEQLAGPVAEVDVVISTAQIPAKAAPLLLTRAMVESMRPGAVIVDVAAPTGGNCELTRPDETVRHHGVTILGPTDLPSRLAADSSRMYARNVLAFLQHLLERSDGAPDLEDEILAGCIITHGGEVVHPRVRELLGETGG